MRAAQPEVPDRASVEAAADVAARAGEELPGILADLERWVNRDSPSEQPDLLDALAAEIAEAAEAAGMRSELVPGTAGLHLHATLEGEGRGRVALICHHDTVFPPGTAGERPFVRRGERAFGPGVADMKGGIAVGLHALRLLAERSRPFARVELISVPDEEPRSGAFETIDRIRGFDAALCLECGRPGGEIVTRRKGAIWLNVEAVGRAAHAGVDPENGSNAIAALCHEAVRIASLSGSRPGLSVELTGLAGGESTNSVAARARLTADVRAWTEEGLLAAAEDIGAFGAHDGVSFELTKTAATPALTKTPKVSLLSSWARGIGAELGASIDEAATGGVSDGCWTAGVGIPTLDGLGPVGGLDHSPGEYIEVDSIPQRCGILAGLLCEIEAPGRYEKLGGDG